MMNQQERQMIAGLAERIRNAPAPPIDRDADELIRRTIGSRPDALYVLTQTVLLQEMALDQAKARIQELEQAMQAPAQPGFLPGGYSQSAYSQPAYEPAPPRSGFSSFLHNAAETAAGVVAGEVAFGALSSLFGGHRGGFFEGGGIMPGGETIVNNYYGDRDPGGADRGDGESRFAQAADDSDAGISPDIEDDRDDSGDDFSGDDFSGGDDSN